MRQIAGDERTTMSALDREECLVLLRWEMVGRLAVGVLGEAPIVIPVNFVADEGTVVFRSDDGPMLDRLREKRVSFQVDRFDWFRRVGWSVLVRGVAHEVSMEDLAHLDLQPWAPGAKAHWMRIVPTAITGRRLQLVEPPWEARGYL